MCNQRQTDLNPDLCKAHQNSKSPYGLTHLAIKIDDLYSKLMKLCVPAKI